MEEIRLHSSCLSIQRESKQRLNYTVEVTFGWSLSSRIHRRPTCARPQLELRVSKRMPCHLDEFESYELMQIHGDSWVNSVPIDTENWIDTRFAETISNMPCKSDCDLFFPQFPYGKFIFQTVGVQAGSRLLEMTFQIGKICSSESITAFDLDFDSDSTQCKLQR